VKQVRLLKDRVLPTLIALESKQILLGHAPRRGMASRRLTAAS
jgi:hypothetical protein